MHPRNRLFIALALVYGLAGGLLALGRLIVSGFAMLAAGSLLAPAPMHLYGGFVLCLIYALGAHMLPRFTGRPIRGGAWSSAQLALFALRLWPVLNAAQSR
jgi:hypothetical protein